MKAEDQRNVYTDHSRDWKANLYVYPVISRRSAGLSIGVNLNPDKACNFDCIYCQVDRSTPGKARGVELGVLRRELDHMLSLAATGAIYSDLRFGAVPAELRQLKDIAFSGDGEPTTCPKFLETVQLAADLKHNYGLGDAKLVLITDACYLNKPNVRRALEILDRNQGEIWAKLDAGTDEYYQMINRPNFPLMHVLENILAVAQIRPVVIQALFMRVHGEPPPQTEIEAFCERLNDITNRGGRIKLVQVYTTARAPAERYVSSLSREQVDVISDTVRAETKLAVEAYYAAP